jgi:hypothetical protein
MTWGETAAKPAEYNHASLITNLLFRHYIIELLYSIFSAVLLAEFAKPLLGSA